MYQQVVGQWRSAAGRGIQISQGTPLEYRYPGEAWRFAIYEDGVEGDQRLYGPRGKQGPGYFAEDGLVAFLDAFVSSRGVLIAYMATREGHTGKGYARKLVQAVYDRWPNEAIDWGQVMDPRAGKLWEWFRENHPDRGNHGSNWYGR